MRVLVQKVLEASVEVAKKRVSQIGEGLLLFVGFTEQDTEEVLKKMAKKVVQLRIFEDERGVMNLSCLEQQKELLAVSQFTLYADTKKGNRPSYIRALKKEKAQILYEKFVSELNTYLPCQSGIFHADMKVSLINDGPTTILLEID